MTFPTPKSIIRTPSGGLAAGLIVGLLLASLASAGLNTLWVARGLVASCFGVAAAYLYWSDATGSMTLREKAGTLAILALVLISVERLETSAQPKPKPIPAFPQPPLMLMFRPAAIRAAGVMSPVANQRFAVSHIGRPEGGYSGFKLLNEDDDSMLGIQDVDIQNLSDERITISWALKVEGEGWTIELPGDGRGRWQRQLNRNDWISLNGSKSGTKLQWLLSPITLNPHEMVLRSRLAFVAPGVSDEVKQLLISGGIDEKYKTWLRFTDMSTGAITQVELPYGKMPKTYNSNVELIKDIARPLDAESARKLREVSAQ